LNEETATSIGGLNLEKAVSRKDAKDAKSNQEVIKVNELPKWLFSLFSQPVEFLSDLCACARANAVFSLNAA